MAVVQRRSSDPVSGHAVHGETMHWSAGGGDGSYLIFGASAIPFGMVLQSIPRTTAHPAIVIGERYKCA